LAVQESLKLAAKQQEDILTKTEAQLKKKLDEIIMKEDDESNALR